MKNSILQLLFIVLSFSLNISFSTAATEQIDHHEQRVEVSDNPEICIDCHDSQVDKNHHPIPISYPPKGKESLFQPADYLKSNSIHLLNGNVVCTSCHNLKNPEKSHLLIDNSNSKLCLFCHKK